jgi:hypothetical protein
MSSINNSLHAFLSSLLAWNDRMPDIADDANGAVDDAIPATHSPQNIVLT